MKSVLIIGGYGGFGARLSKRLAKAGWKVLVAGRRLDAATTFCATLPGSVPIEANRNGELGPLLSDLKPDLVVDAAGPFQGSDYRLPRACITAKIDYLDLADARDFVCNIGELDEDARRAGVCVISGASSVPALSGAVVRELATDLTHVTSIDMAISASNRATAGPSVAASIMSYVGKPLNLWRGGKWSDATGWHMLRREVFNVKGRKPLHRLTALSDVPDHSIMPDMVAGRPATTFRAGPEFPFQVIGVWILSWLVKWRVIPSLLAMSGWLRYLQAPTNGLGSDRSGMYVELKGLRDGQGLIKRWTLIAEEGDGPEIPTLAAVLLANMIADKNIAKGARDGSSLLALSQFEPLFSDLAIYHATTQSSYVPLYQRIMHDKFRILPKAVAQIHSIIGNGGAFGEATVTRGPSWLAGIVCKIMGFPPEGKITLHVGFDEHKGSECWTRDFGGAKFSSILSQSKSHLTESFGPLAFTFDLVTNDKKLTMEMLGWTAFGIAMPKWLGPLSDAREWEDDGDFCFEVAIDLPLIGRVVHYQGRLKTV
jgi:hypothetical protein